MAYQRYPPDKFHVNVDNILCNYHNKTLSIYSESGGSEYYFYFCLCPRTEGKLWVVYKLNRTHPRTQWLVLVKRHGEPRLLRYGGCGAHVSTEDYP